mmetsp:Transcript_6790/g.8834  ORF Transcript_6790/g.8834 Transcript_6790/m.8834 type:complete len:290 (+) Transcript_6790:155-1024(+)
MAEVDLPLIEGAQKDKEDKKSLAITKKSKKRKKSSSSDDKPKKKKDKKKKSKKKKVEKATEASEVKKQTKSEDSPENGAGTEENKSNGKEVEDSHKEEDKLEYKKSRIFIGQLPFHATKEDIQRHFSKHGVGKMEIRLLTDRKTKRSRGIAFATLEDSWQLVKALRVHHSRLKGRMINVERTCGGGGNSERRKSKIKALRERQGTKVLMEVRKQVQDVFNEVNPTDISVEDVDDRAIEALGTFPREISENILREFFELDVSGIKNKKAYLMGIVKRCRENPATFEKSEE